MFVLDQDKISKFLGEIREGFIRTPLEITIFIVLVLGIILFFFFMYRYQTTKRRLHRQKIEQELFLQGVIKKGLTQVERDILEKMALYLKPNQGKHLLLENPHIFNSCLENMKKQEDINQQIAAGLRMKLGFRRPGLEKVIHSSVDLPEDLPVLILQKSKKQCSGKIKKVEPDSLIVDLKSPLTSPVPGTPVRVYFKSHSGIFSFRTRVKKSSKNLLFLAHSENIDRLQRRKFYRKRISQPVYIRLFSSEEPVKKSTLLDLGGGGASLKNVEKAFKPGDELELTFYTSGRQQVTLTGKVIQLSEGGKTLHLEFENIPESIRDTIISYIFSQ